MNKNELLRQLPKMDSILASLANDGLQSSKIKQAAHEVLQNIREDLLSGAIECIPSDINSIILEKAGKSELFLRSVINATGIVLHTNLGRSPLSVEAAEFVKDIALGYSNLEYDISEGVRGSRTDGVQRLLCKLTGAEDAAIVNNNAAAVLLALSAIVSNVPEKPRSKFLNKHATYSCSTNTKRIRFSLGSRQRCISSSFKNKGNWALNDGRDIKDNEEKKQIIVSRGELVEIGGSFRIPNIVSQGGATLLEVGTTNKTKLIDYEEHISHKTAAILKVHTSNYRILGYTQEVSVKELYELSQYVNIPLIYDLGGGSMQDKDFLNEPAVQKLVPYTDLLCFSGDKLLGGPQAGIVLGKKRYIQKLKKHPLYRALRSDKLSLAALEATLLHYKHNETHKIPIVNMLSLNKEELLNAANELYAAITLNGKYNLEIKEVFSQAGGGSLPCYDIPSYAVAIEPLTMTTAQLERALRTYSLPIISRIYKGKVLLDVRTIKRQSYNIIAKAITEIFYG